VLKPPRGSDLISSLYKLEIRSDPRATPAPDRRYALVPRSRFLPVRSEDVTRWIFSEDSVGMLEWEDRLRDWVRTELVPRGELPPKDDRA
jgi:hypothetical protein